jgi:metal-sulfur cluster biosynthetic enzyme
MMNPIADTLVVATTIEALRSVYDPELGIDVVALGLIYDIDVDGDDITIDMTLTTPGCPVSEQLPAEVSQAASAALPDAEVEVRIVWDPPWTPDRMSAEPYDEFGNPTFLLPGTQVGVPRRHASS